MPDEQEQLGTTQAIETVVATAERPVKQRMRRLRLLLYPGLVGLLLSGYWLLLRRGVATPDLWIELLSVGVGALLAAYLLELGFHLSTRRQRYTRPLQLLLVTCFVLVATYALQLNGSLTSYMVLFYALVIFFTRLRLDAGAARYATTLAAGCFLGVVALELLGWITYARMLQASHAPAVYREPVYALVIVVGALAFLMLTHLGAEVLVSGLATREVALASVTWQLKERNVELQETLEQLRQVQQELVLKEKMATIGGLVSGVLHEINNPMGALRAAADTVGRAADQLERAVADADSLDNLRGGRKLRAALRALREGGGVTQEAGQRVAEVAERLGRFAKLDQAEYQVADLHAELDATVETLGEVLGQRVEVVRRFDEALPRLGCYPGLLNQAFYKLLDNAARSIEGKGQIILETRRQGQRVQVVVKDTGRGIPAELLEGIFDVGFNAKRQRRIGLSVGLAMVQGIVQKHDGTIEVQSEVGRGTSFIISLPLRGGDV
jgi:signal transduction histidine kinase